MCSGQTRCPLSAPVNSRSATAHPIALSSGYFHVGKTCLLLGHRQPQQDQDKSHSAGQHHIHFCSFLSSSCWSLLLSVCSYCKKNPRGVQDFPKKPRIFDYTICPVLTNLVLANPTKCDGRIWSHMICESWWTPGTHQLPSLRRRQQQA